ncbi:MAG: CRISPR-associated endonuclease Cas3'', partial [Gottschalkiaceae bacterium]
MNRFLAKSEPEETIQEHTNNLMSNYYLLKELYPNIKYLNWEILKLACLYHDLGKINTKFQNKIMKKIGYELLDDELVEIDEVNHNYLSPAFLPKKKLEQKYDSKQLKVLYQSIYRHHNRELPHFEDMKEIIEKDLKDHLEEFNINGYEHLIDIDLSESLSYKYRKEVKNPIIPREDGVDTFYNYVITKGLLNKIDYAASSYIGNSRLSVEVQNKDLKQKVNDFFSKNNFSKNDLQKYMESNKEENNIIIASTGVGKTEASLLWIGNDKGFFTLPLRVSINAIFDRIKTKDLKFEDVGLLHSDTYSEYLKRTKDENFDDYYYHQTKQMSLPLTVCTLDQLIDFIFRYEGFEIK